MPSWKEFRKVELDGVELTIKERADVHNHHGALEYIVEARILGELIITERVSQNKWLGHCYGQLLLPMIVERAHRINTRPLL